MNNADVFLSDWASPPGDTITELLEELNLGLDDFAQRMSISHTAAEDLIRGNTEVTDDTAELLETIVGGSKRFWMNREQQYQQSIRRVQDCNAAEFGESWLDELPTKDLVKFGWIRAVPSKSERLTECLRFFGVGDVKEWRTAYAGIIKLTAFKTSTAFESRPGAVAAWLRQGELEAEEIECQPWNAGAFREALNHIRTLTRKRSPNLFLPELKAACAACGVAVVIVRTPVGCRASGSTRFISPTKAILALSFRYLSDDHFWFTFFHEAAHLLLHQKNRLFLEWDSDQVEEEEVQANNFAAETLIPAGSRSRLMSLPVDGHAVIRFARNAGISSGIVVGQLQHLGHFRRNQLNNLKTRFKWAE